MYSQLNALGFGGLMLDEAAPRFNAVETLQGVNPGRVWAKMFKE
jgi:hypothetical protein